MKKIDIAAAPARRGSAYPPPYDAPCAARLRRRLGEAGGLTAFGVNHLTLAPGAWSSQRHWHELEDEFLYMVRGELVLVTDAGEEVVRAGDCAAFKAGVRDGHCLQNRSATDAVFLAMSSKDAADHGEYSDLDMKFLPGRSGYVRKDGSAF